MSRLILSSCHPVTSCVNVRFGISPFAAPAASCGILKRDDPVDIVISTPHDVDVQRARIRGVAAGS